jgi:7,8-dihydroneopterin aldolase/epimerase/oxygenase
MKQMDKILISKIDCVAAIGVTAEERTIKQRLSIDVEFTIDNRRAAETDSLRDAIDYAEVAQVVAEVCAGRDFKLIETVAEHIATRVLSDFAVSPIRVLVRKIAPVVEPPVALVSVEIVRP